MTCTRIGNAIVCINPCGRLHVGNRYIWVDFHEWCGPMFSYDQNGDRPYDPVDEQDPVWPAFEKRLERYNASKARKKKA